MTRNGAAYALPTWEPRTDASVSSSLLPTPIKADGEGGRTKTFGMESGTLPGAVSLLPTPEAKLSDSGPDYARADRQGSGGDDLTTALHKLLPTPDTSMGNRGERSPEALASGSHQANLNDLPRLLPKVKLLPTPTAQAAKHSADDRGPGTLDDGNLWSVAARIGADALLPTPMSRDYKGYSPADGNRNSPNLSAMPLLLHGADTGQPSTDGNGPSDV
jgi:hypothetical protein